MSFLNVVGSMVKKAGFWCKQHSPEILTISGIMFETAATVTACVATSKAIDIVEKTKEEFEKIDLSDEYTEEEAKKEKRKLSLKTTGKLAGLYAPALGLSVSGVVCILYGNKILNNRNAALAIGMAGLAGEFKDYRDRTKEMFGEDVDMQLRHGLKLIESKETVVDENGKKKTVKKTYKVVEEPDNGGRYTRIYDWTNPHWNECMDYNKMLLRSQQYYFNDLLRAEGHVYLNDVLKALGFPVTKTGHETGWTLNPDDPVSDNYIDFRVCEVSVPLRNEGGEVVGYRNALALDFNVDGAITDKVLWDEE